MAAPIPAKPRSIIAQVPGSGTAGTLENASVSPKFASMLLLGFAPLEKTVSVLVAPAIKFMPTSDATSVRPVVIDREPLLLVPLLKMRLVKLTSVVEFTAAAILLTVRFKELKLVGVVKIKLL